MAPPFLSLVCVWLGNQEVNEQILVIPVDSATSRGMTGVVARNDKNVRQAAISELCKNDRG